MTPVLTCVYTAANSGGDQSSKSPRIDAAGELFRNIVRMAEGPLNSPTLILVANYFVIIVRTSEGPLNPPTLGDFEDLPPPQNDAAGELFCNIVITAEGPLNPPILGDFEDMLPQNWGLGGLKNPRFIANISKC